MNLTNHGFNDRAAHVARGLTGASLALATLFGSVYGVADTWTARVNELLGATAQTGISRSTNAADYTYVSDFDDPNDLVQAEIDYNTRVEEEGATLLKGSPIVDGTKVTLFGMRSGDKMQFGEDMGATISSKQTVGLAEALAGGGFEVNPVMTDFYDRLEKQYAPGQAAGGNMTAENVGATINEVPVSEYGQEQIGSYSRYSDAAIVVLGRDSTEGCDYYPGGDGIADGSEFDGEGSRNDILTLSDDERDLIAHVERQGFRKIIVLLNADNAMSVDELAEDDAIDSIMWIGTPGCYGTYGIANILAGKAVPSGHLTDTYAADPSKAPAAVNMGAYVFSNAVDTDSSENKSLRSDWYLVENESIYIGYKYYETRYWDEMTGQGNATAAMHGETANGSAAWNYDDEVTYPFGYGIEGSTFDEKITDMNIDFSGGRDSTVTIRVTNTGDNAAKHVVQLYVNVPYTDTDGRHGVEKSAIQLIGYAKTGEADEKDHTQRILLEPGDSEDLTITFNARDMMSYDAKYEHDGTLGAYVASAGTYWFMTGNGAHDAVNAALAASRPDRFANLKHTGDARSADLDQDEALTESNGTVIENRLQDGDLASYGFTDEAKRLSRTDWPGTWPEEIDSLAATDEMIPLLRNETTSAAADAADSYDGDADFVYDTDHGIMASDLIGRDEDDPIFDEFTDQMSLQYIIDLYMSKAGELPDYQLPKLTGADSPRGLVSTFGRLTNDSIYEIDENDEAYGHEANVYVGPMLVAATYSRKLAEEEGRLIGNDALWCGVMMWNGPAMNIHRTQYCDRNGEYYSEDPVLTGLTAKATIAGANGKGLVTETKHFAFNDQETNRDGLAVFVGEQAGRENELRSFDIALRDSSATSGLMTGLNRLGCTHTAASDGLINGVLKGEWGWDGFLITDSVKSTDYFQPTNALFAGNDLMLGGATNGPTWGYTPDAIVGQPAVQARLRDVFKKTMYVYANGLALNGLTSGTTARDVIPWWKTLLMVCTGMSSLAVVAAAGFWAAVTVSRRRRPASGTDEGMAMAETTGE